MNLTMFDNVLKIYQELQSTKTHEELTEIFKAGNHMIEQAGQMFAVGQDAANDIVQISMIFLAMIERLAQPEGQRALPKPLKECRTLADIAASL